MPALATSRICDERKLCTLARALAVTPPVDTAVFMPVPVLPVD
jgi:hypothetical protein